MRRTCGLAALTANITSNYTYKDNILIPVKIIFKPATRWNSMVDIGTAFDQQVDHVKETFAGSNRQRGENTDINVAILFTLHVSIDSFEVVGSNS